MGHRFPLPLFRSSRIARLLAAFTGVFAALAVAAGPTLACGGLIGPNGAVNLLRTTTLAGYHNGIEHYVTAFQFAGGGGEFGSIVPLPGVPTEVVRGGDWTLQRLVRETNPVREFDAAFGLAAAPAAQSAEILLETRIDALDITVLRGGADQVGEWATKHGFRLPPDAPEVLDFYANRSPIFMAAVFDADAAQERGQSIGDGTPVHITIPTDNPWVPLRILALGRTASERIDADVFLLTDRPPAMLPQPGDGSNGLVLDHFADASTSLLDDLRSDVGMEWIPSSAWLTKVRIDTAAPDLRFDLAIDASGNRAPSPVAAGLPAVVQAVGAVANVSWAIAVAMLVTVVAWSAVWAVSRRRPSGAQPA
jgi:uncharacterized protein DUF2330